jgi:hypothetical protein
MLAAGAKARIENASSQPNTSSLKPFLISILLAAAAGFDLAACARYQVFLLAGQSLHPRGLSGSRLFPLPTYIQSPFQTSISIWKSISFTYKKLWFAAHVSGRHNARDRLDFAKPRPIPAIIWKITS